MATSEQFEIVLRGGKPWGFRLQGGKEFRAPLRIAKVNHGGKSHIAGVQEGDVVKSINGGDAQEWTHSEALAAIKRSTDLLVMILKRTPGAKEEFSSVSYGDMSAGYSNGYDAIKVPQPPDPYARVAPFATLPRGNNTKPSAPPPVKPKPKTPPSSPQKKSPPASTGMPTSPREDGDDWSAEMVNNALRPPQPIRINSYEDDHRQNMQAVHSGVPPSHPPHHIHPPPRVHQPPKRNPRPPMDFDSHGPSRPRIQPGGGWYKNMFKEMHAGAGAASNLSALLASDVSKGTMQEDESLSPRSMSPPAGPRSISPPVTEASHMNMPDRSNMIDRSRKSSSSSSSSLPPTRPPFPDAGGGKPAQWYKDIHQNLVNDAGRPHENGPRMYHMPQAPAIHRPDSPRMAPVTNKLPPALSMEKQLPDAPRGTYSTMRPSPNIPVVNSQDEIMKREPTPTSLYESQFWRGQQAEQKKDAISQQKVSPKTEEIARQRELELQILREEEKREEQKRRQEEARWRKEEEERRRREEERRKEEERRWLEEQRRREEEARRKAEEAKQQAPKEVAMAKALYSFQAQNPSELGFKKGDVIKITKSVDKNWFEGEFQGRIGIFPASYVEVLPAGPPATMPSPPPAPKAVDTEEGEGRVKYNFKPESSRELALRKGDMVFLTRRVDDNWFEGRSLTGQIGIFPVTYVDVVRNIGEKTKVVRQEKPPFIEEIINQQPPSWQQQTSPVQMQTQSSAQFQERSPSPDFPEPPTSLAQVKGEKYRVIYSYLPQNEDELELEDGDVVTVLEKCDDGWFVGISQKTGHFGTFPGNYVRKN